MTDAPLLGPPVGITTHDDGLFTVEFAWATAPDAMWLKALSDLMRRAGRDSVVATLDSLALTFNPQDTEGALDDLQALLEEAAVQYANDREHRDAAIAHVQETLEARFGAGADLPVKQA
jgi:hypothetical protein